MFDAGFHPQIAKDFGLTKAVILNLIAVDYAMEEHGGELYVDENGEKWSEAKWQWFFKRLWYLDDTEVYDKIVEMIEVDGILEVSTEFEHWCNNGTDLFHIRPHVKKGGDNESS